MFLSFKVTELSRCKKQRDKPIQLTITITTNSTYGADASVVVQ